MLEPRSRLSIFFTATTLVTPTWSRWTYPQLIAIIRYVECSCCQTPRVLGNVSLGLVCLGWGTVRPPGHHRGRYHVIWILRLLGPGQVLSATVQLRKGEKRQNRHSLVAVSAGYGGRLMFIQDCSKLVQMAIFVWQRCIASCAGRATAQYLWPWTAGIFGQCWRAGWHLAFVDHKLLTFAMAKLSELWSTCQQLHLSYILEFTTDVRHIESKANVVADCLSAFILDWITPGWLWIKPRTRRCRLSRWWRQDSSCATYPSVLGTPPCSVMFP